MARRKRARYDEDRPNKQMFARQRVRLAASRLRKKGEQVDYNLHDPVGRHILSLRKFYASLLKPKPRGKPAVPVSELHIPEFPEEYPTSEFLAILSKNRNKQPLNFKSHLSEEKVKVARTIAVKNILLQIGFSDEKMDKNTDGGRALEILSQMTEEFLQSFMKRMVFHKCSSVFRNSPDLWDSFESTLHDFGFGGIRGLGNYYAEYIQLNKAVYSDCIRKLNEMGEKEIKMQQKAAKKSVPLEKDSSKSYEIVKDKNCNAALVKDKATIANDKTTKVKGKATKGKDKKAKKGKDINCSGQMQQ